ncbi:MAG: biopolymer transporter ExbD [Pseudomonadota bacterium]
MQFEHVKIRRRRGEGVVPMINVAFLLMIFFLMSTTLAPERNTSVALPEAVSGKLADEGRALVVAADGTMAWGQFRDDAAIEAIAATFGDGSGRVLTIRADRNVEGAVIARLIARLGAEGVTDSALMTGG